MFAPTVEISRIMSCMERRERDLAMMRGAASEQGACCVTCLFGAKYAGLADKQDRTRAWLLVLLVKSDVDRGFVDAVKDGAWP